MDDFIINQNNKIYYRVTGNGYPVVFLHGFLENSKMWVQTISNFNNEIMAINIDLPCHGKSIFNGDVCSMEFMAKSVFKILNKLKIENPVVLGHSMGGYVSLELLKLYKCKPVLIHSNFWADSIEKKKDRDRVVEIVKRSPKFFIKQAIPNLFYKLNLIKYQKEVNTIINEACVITADQICASTIGMKERFDNSTVFSDHDIMLIQGEFDTTITLKKTSENLNKLGLINRLKIIKNCGHMSFIEQTLELNEIIKNILIEGNAKINLKKGEEIK